MQQAIFLLSLFGTLCLGSQYFEVQVLVSTVSYNIDGVENPNITLTRGVRYDFVLKSTVSNDGNGFAHPFWIKTIQGSGPSNGASGVINNGATTGNVTFTPVTGTPDTLYYNCEYHPSMTGIISIVDAVTTGTTGTTGQHTTGRFTTGRHTTGTFTTGTTGTTGRSTTGRHTTGTTGRVYTTGTTGSTGTTGTTAQYTTGQFTTGRATTGVYTTGRYSTGQFTTGQFTTGIPTTGSTGTTGTTGRFTTGQYTTGQFTTGRLTTGTPVAGFEISVDAWDNGNPSISLYDFLDYDLANAKFTFGDPICVPPNTLMDVILLRYILEHSCPFDEQYQASKWRLNITSSNPLQEIDIGYSYQFYNGLNTTSNLSTTVEIFECIGDVRGSSNLKICYYGECTPQ